jgi:hypothetical protein
LGKNGVVAPELLPGQIQVTSVQPCKKLDGTVVLSAVVDATGNTKDVFFLRPIGNDLDKLALIIAVADRFKPGTLDGANAAIALAIEIGMRACVEDVPGSTSGDYTVKLRSQPEQTIQPPSKVHDSSVLASRWKPNKGVTPPLPLVQIQPVPGSEKCLVSVLIDEHGMPQDLKVVKGPNGDFCRQTLAAVSRERYEPALRNGEPVAVWIQVDLGFAR